MLGAAVLYNLIIRSQTFSKSMPLDCELHKHFSVFLFFFFFLSPVRWTGCLEWIEFGYIPSTKLMRLCQYPGGLAQVD